MSISSHLSPSSFSIFQNRLSFSAFSGLSSGITASLFDVYQASSSLHCAYDLLLLFFHAASRLGFLGFFFSSLLSSFFFFFEFWFHKKDFSFSKDIFFFPIRYLSLFCSLLLSPGCVFLSYRLFQGGFVSKLPFKGLLAFVTFSILLLFVFSISAFIFWIIRISDVQNKRSRLSLFLGISFFLLAALFHYIDGHYYRRLYLYIHSVLGLLTLLGFGLFFRLIFFNFSLLSFSFKPFLFFSFFLSFALLVSFFTFNNRQSVKVSAYENTASLSIALHTIPFFSFSPSWNNSSNNDFSKHKSKHFPLLSSSQGDFPVFPNTNVLLISVDALRADKLGIYGNKKRILSPNLDSWSKKSGIVFERAYCTAPHSSYSISSIHTGRFIHDDVRLKRKIEFPTLPDILRENNFITYGLFTKGIFFTEGDSVAHYRSNNFGIEHVFGGAPRPDELTDRVIAEIDRSILKNQSPFFIWAHYFNVHEPYLSTVFGNSPEDRYDGEILEADREIGRLLDYANAKLKDDLLIIFTSDHGEEFKEHGGYYHGSSLYDEQIRVPLIFQIPGVNPRIIHHPVSNASISPTLLHLLGLSPASSMISNDLRPLIFGSDDIITESPVFSSVVNQHMVLKLPFKLIIDPSIGRFELFNIEYDPAEKINLFDNRKDIADELRSEIEGFLDFIGQEDSKNKACFNLGYMKDPRSVSCLVSIILDNSNIVSDRVEALRLLGSIRDYTTIPLLKQVLQDDNRDVALAAAFSLGSLGDRSGDSLLFEALSHDVSSLRIEAALILGNDNAFEAVPALIEALARDDDDIKREAIKALGKLRAFEAAEFLLDILHTSKLKYQAVLSLGMIGDYAAYQPLLDIINSNDQLDVRGYAVVALGWLAAVDSIPRLLKLLAQEPEIKWTTETLVRLGAVGHSPLFGTDATNNSKELRSGWGVCNEKDYIIPSEYLNRSVCETVGSRADLLFEVIPDNNTFLIIRARRLPEDVADVIPIPLNIFLNGRLVGSLDLTVDFSEARIPINKSLFRTPPTKNNFVLKLASKGRFELDHLLVLAADNLL